MAGLGLGLGLGLARSTGGGGGGSSLSAFTFAEDAAFQNANQAIGWSGYTFTQTISGLKSAGAIELHRFNHATKKRDTFPLQHRFAPDDHCTGAVLRMPSDKLFTCWQLHGDNVGTRYTISTGDATAAIPTFVARQTTGAGAGLCAYAEAHWLSTDGGATGHVFIFMRMNSTTTSDRGYWVTTIAELETFAAGGAAPTWTFQLIFNNTGQRPYSEGRKKDNTTLHFVGNLGNYGEISGDALIWHTIAKYDGTTTLKWYKSDGTTEITASKPFDVSNFTVVRDGSTGDIGWYDMAFAADGHPMILSDRFTTGSGTATADRVSGISKFNGTSWLTTEYLTGQGPPIATVGQYGQINGARFDGNDPTKAYLVEKTLAATTLGGSLTQWSVDYTQIGSGTPMVRTATLVPETVGVGIFRPMSVPGHGPDDPVYYVKQQGWTDFQNFNADLMVYGSYVTESVASLEAETTAIIARMTTPPTDRLKAALNSFIRDMKGGYGYDLWAKRGVMHLLAAEAADQAILDLADIPGTGANNAQLTLSPTFTASRGYRGDATNFVTFNAPNAIPGASQNSVAIAAFFGNTTTSGNALWAVTTSQLTAVPGPAAAVRINSIFTVVTLPASGYANQFIGGSRNVAGTATAFGSLGKVSGAATSSAPTSDRRKTAIAAGMFSQFYWASQYLTDDEMNFLRYLVMRLMRDVRAVEG